jgi:predicted deacetylase
MSKHEARITGNAENGFYALIVRLDKDGQESVIHGYKGRHFTTRARAEKSTAQYIARLAA